MKLKYFKDYIVILNTQSFCVFAPSHPHIDRIDGGHICISATRNSAYLIQDLSDIELYELSILQKIVGQAMMDTLNNNGVDIRLINYQINGNWTFFSPNRPLLHVHLYGRALSAIKQPFGQSLYFPLKENNYSYYEGNKPLSMSDCNSIFKSLVSKIASDYSDIIIIQTHYNEE